ncbi:MAG: hypothetical protein AAF591_20325 [Verrucomicrobiota bacterium]
MPTTEAAHSVSPADAAAPVGADTDEAGGTGLVLKVAGFDSTFPGWF